MIRAHDWEATALGAPDGWPQSLRTAIRLMLNSRHPIFIFWGSDSLCFFNDAYGPSIGAERRASATGRPGQAVWAEIWDVIGPQIDQVMAGRGATWHENHLVPITRDGRLEDVFWTYSYSPIDDADTGTGVGGVMVIATETTAQVSAERDLREASERIQLALHAGAIVGTWVWDVPQDRITADERFARCFGLDADLCRTGFPLGQATDSIHEDDRQRVTEAIAEALRRGGGYKAQFRVRNGDAADRGADRGADKWAYRWIEANGRVECAADGTARRFPGVLIDIEEQRAAEMARDRALELLRTFTEAVPGVVYAKDRQGRMLVANRGVTDLIGKPPSFYLGRTDAEFLDDAAQAETVMATDRRIMETGIAEQVEEDVRLPDGRPAVWLSTKAPLRDPHGNITGLIGASLDITARKQSEAALRDSQEQLRRLNETLERRVAAAVAEREHAQEALRQSQKLESMGQLTGGVAHDFNNLLTPIIGSLDILIRRGIGGERERRLIDGAMQSAERAKTLVQRLLAFARRQPLQPVPVDLVQLVQGMAGLVGSTSGPRVKIEVDLPADLPPVQADPNQLEMAILNLAVNARDAMPEGGRLTIAADRAHIDRGHPSKAAPGAYVRLAVSDTGTGMDEATLARAVEPFFSTKGIGRGTGLGLSMVHGLAAQLGGSLTIRSRPALGTSVELWLPVATHPAPKPSPPDTPPPLPAAGRVLLVDDEDLVRASTADMLAELGYQVTEARSAEQALAMVDQGLAPDIVVTDHLMPGLTGTDLARTLHKRKIARVLIVSGYADDDGIAPDLPRLTKPFRQTELAAALTGILAPRA